MGLQIKSRITVGANTVFATAMLLLLGTSCIKEHLADGGTALKPDEAEVVMRLKTPGSFSSSGGTRGLSVTQENDIDDIYVLVFDKNNELSDIKQGRDISTPGGGAFNIRTFTATFAASRTDLDKYNLVVLANAASVLTATIGTDYGSFSGSKAYADIWPQLEAAISGKMFASGGTIPMWGETGQIVVQAGASANVDLPLHRAIARIDVGVGAPTTITDATGAKEYEWTNPTAIPFVIEEVFVFRPDDKYSLIPDPAKFSTTDPKKATAPTVPTLSTKFAADVSEAKFKFSGLGEITGGLYTTQSIYVPEADIRMGVSGKPGDANHENRMAVIVGGYYNGSTTPSYYRLDFVKDGALLDVLRNHLYQFNIKAVTGPGYPDPETAYKSLALNMTVEIHQWNDAEIGEIVFDGQYYLSVSDKSLEFGRNSKTSITMHVVTDYPTGWDYEITDSPTKGGAISTWCKYLSNTTNGAGVKDDFKFSIDENTTDVERYAYIHFTAGRVSLVVKVTQTTQTQLNLSLIPDFGEIVFPSGLTANTQINDVTLRIDWEPINEDVTVTYTTISEGGVPLTGSSPTVFPLTLIGGTGTRTITFEAEALASIPADPVYERISRLDFTVISGNQSINKSLFVRQKNYGLATNLTNNTVTYQLATAIQEKSFTVRANARWEATITGGTLVSDITPSGTGKTLGETFSFKIAEGNATNHSATSEITFTSPDGVFDDVVITIYGRFDILFTSGATTYVAYPSDRGVYANITAASTGCTALGTGWRLPDITELRNMVEQIGTVANGFTRSTTTCTPV